MTGRFSPGTWVLVVTSIGALLGALALRSFQASKHQAAIDQRSALTTRQVRGPRAVRFVDHGDTLSLDAPHESWVLLLVIRGDCDACDRLTKRLTSELQRLPERHLQVWLAGSPPQRALTSLQRSGAIVRDAHALDDSLMRRELEIAGLPYLAAVDSTGAVAAVRVGYWSGPVLEHFRGVGLPLWPND